MAGFTRRQKITISLRDGGRCCVCGGEATTTQHRRNRGAGGSKTVNTLSNGCAICDTCNFNIEAVGAWADKARALGVKIRRNASYSPADVPLRTFQPGRGVVWLMVDDYGSSVEISPADAQTRLADLGIVDVVTGVGDAL